MKKIYIFLILSAGWLNVSSQEEHTCLVFENHDITSSLLMEQGICKSTYGRYFPTQGTFRALTFFVNIIYDQTPTVDPCINSTSNAWPSSLNNGLNINPPTYMLSLFDKDILPNASGVITRLYAESSFYQLNILSDFVIVNIKQSQITPASSGANFSSDMLIKSVISYVNSIGFQTFYGNNNSAEYDKCTPKFDGLPKVLQPDNKIDLTCFLIRNSTKTHGGLSRGSGLTYYGYSLGTNKLLIGGQGFDFNALTYQCVGDGDITLDKKNILTHEFAHLFLGGNDFHTSGGVTNNDSYHNTFFNNQMGYGLFNGGLLSCNGYERWRLGWQHPSNNSYPIASDSQNADVEKFEGERTFTLRDFATYGDAVRIKLPYKDNTTSSNQYIWFENHQIGKNGKLDGHIYMDRNLCRTDQGGIFAYYQVGRDIIEGECSDVFLSYEKDNLKIISAEGNYNVQYLTKVEDCLGFAGGNHFPQFEYLSQNSLQGVNDQTNPNSFSTSLTSLQYPADYHLMGSKIKNGIVQNDLPCLGDKFDAFLPTSFGKTMDISTNPSSINTTTYYCTKSSTMNIISTARNTHKLYLTGLSIKMIDPNPNDTEMKAYTLKIRWDDYDVKQSINWTGDIVLKEHLNLLSGKKITLEQNRTPNQIEKDPVSNFFAKTTFFTCEENSTFTMNTGSAVLLEDKSSFIMNNSSTLTIQNGAILFVKKGATLMIKEGANINIQGTGKIVVESGGYVCIEQGANINLQNYTSVIALEKNAVLGANPLLFATSSCLSNISSYVGDGSIVDYSQDVYIQNETIFSNRYIAGKNIYIGKNVITSKPTGDVIIANGANVLFDATEEVYFEQGFECELGSSFEVVK